MSHEIRTPMNGVLGMTQILLDSGLTAEQRRYAEVVEHSGRHLLAIIDEILDFSKIEAGRMTLEAVPFELDGLCGEAVRLVEGRATGKGIAIGLEVAATLPVQVIGDPLRLRQVLVNLLDNAVKFTERGQVTLAVDAEPASAGSVRVRIAVRDTGVGIPAAQRSRIFQHFTQADSSTTRTHGGTGLGLAICNQLVGLMEGSIEVDSQEGRGSTFTVTLRLPVAAQEPGGDGAVAAAPVPAPGRRVLLAEDNPVNQVVARALLARLGCEVEIAATGEEALRLHEAGGFDLILMDCMMPGLDGYEATTEIRRRESAGARTPVVAMTANAMQGDRERCLAAGMDDYLSKPVSRDVLAAVLTRWLPEVAGR